MHDFQVWLVTTIYKHSPVADLMRTARKAWPIAEEPALSWLVLLVGAIGGTFDLRLLGIARKVPIAAVHASFRGVWPFAISILTGTLFIFTEPDQYIYNPSFH